MSNGCGVLVSKRWQIVSEQANGRVLKCGVDAFDHAEAMRKGEKIFGHVTSVCLLVNKEDARRAAVRAYKRLICAQ